MCLAITLFLTLTNGFCFQAAEIKKEAKFLMDQNESLLNDTAVQWVESKELLDRGIKHQQVRLVNKYFNFVLYTIAEAFYCWNYGLNNFRGFHWLMIQNIYIA